MYLHSFFNGETTKKTQPPAPAKEKLRQVTGEELVQGIQRLGL